MHFRITFGTTGNEEIVVDKRDLRGAYDRLRNSPGDQQLQGLSPDVGNPKLVRMRLVSGQLHFVILPDNTQGALIAISPAEFEGRVLQTMSLNPSQ